MFHGLDNLFCDKRLCVGSSRSLLILILQWYFQLPTSGSYSINLNTSFFRNTFYIYSQPLHQILFCYIRTEHINSNHRHRSPFGICSALNQLFIFSFIILQNRLKTESVKRQECSEYSKITCYKNAYALKRVKTKTFTSAKNSSSPALPNLAF